MSFISEMIYGYAFNALILYCMVLLATMPISKSN